jgi:hypothetical protein
MEGDAQPMTTGATAPVVPCRQRGAAAGDRGHDCDVSRLTRETA